MTVLLAERWSTWVGYLGDARWVVTVQFVERWEHLGWIFGRSSLVIDWVLFDVSVLSSERVGFWRFM